MPPPHLFILKTAKFTSLFAKKNSKGTFKELNNIHYFRYTTCISRNPEIPERWYIWRVPLDTTIAMFFTTAGP